MFPCLIGLLVLEVFFIMLATVAYMGSVIFRFRSLLGCFLLLNNLQNLRFRLLKSRL